MSSREWQAGLRRQFGREQSFEVENLGEERFFSDFKVHSDSGRSYVVSIRGTAPGDNRCTCPDFRTNLLGTCKHIEYLLFHLESKRGSKKAFAAGFQPAFSEVYLRYGAEHEVRFRPGSDCTPALKRRARSVFDENHDWRLRPDSLTALEDFLAAASRSKHEVRWREDVLDYIARARRDRHRHRVLSKVYPEGAQSPALASLLSLKLYPYQCEGAWFAARAGRAIIADDMGLGKTIQAIATAEIMLRHLGARRILIVCPTSLRHQWQEEVERLAGRSVRQVIGPPPARARAYVAPETVKVVSYESARRDIALINAWQPDLVIADEAQRIKNWDTRLARAMKRIRSPYALILTGTPIENRLAELVSIVQFVDQHRLGPTWRFLEHHQETDEVGRVIGYRRLDEVAATLAPIMIRRRKETVLTQLPPRRDKTFLLPLTAEQHRLHAEYGETVARIVAQWRKRGFLTDREQKRLMAALQNMRMVCDSTYLVDHEQNRGNKIAEVMRVIDELSSEPSNRIVLFSQWLRAHELVQHELDKRGIGHVFFHGGVPAKKRAALIRRFREDPDCRLFLSTDVGGTGLNLQHATVVINLDLPWNPAVLEQRIGRVHRLGQHQPVQVMNFVAQDSIEERLLELLDFKRSLASGVLDGGNRTVNLGGTRLSRFMKDVEQVTGRGDDDSRHAGLPTATDAQGAPVPPQKEDSSETGAAREGSGDSSSGAETRADGGGTPSFEDNPWAPLLQFGQALLAEIVAAGESGSGAGGTDSDREDRKDSDSDKGINRSRTRAGNGRLVRRDPDTGENYLHLPAPKPKTLAKLTDALSELLGAGKD
ncbi:MAG: helicase SNF2 [Gammaproteobacteria bacterium]|nr:MAG: helicase SNF2 [Gammaproteobacteria bacterium]